MSAAASRQLIAFGPFEFDAASGLLCRDKQEIPLPMRVAKVLEVFLARPGEVLSKEELLSEVWADAFVGEDSLTQAISVIRNALEDDPHDPIYIQTIPKRGYRFIAKITTKPGTGEANPLVGPAVARTLLGVPRSAALAAMVLIIGIALGWIGTALITEQALQTEQPIPTTTPLTSLEGYETYPALSPDGRQVAFIWDGGNGGRRHLYIQSVSGLGGPMQRTFSDRDDWDPTWSPDGDRIAFIRWSRGDTEAEILWIPAIGGPESRITTKPERGYREGLDWSPDGKYLAFPNVPDDPEGPVGIFLLSLETSEKHQVTFPPTEGSRTYYDDTPAFSPDGAALAFFRKLERSGGAGDLFVQPLRGVQPSGGPRRLTSQAYAVWDLDWTQNGDAIVYSEGISEGASYLKKAPLNGGEATRLLVGERARFLSVGSDGDRLLYSRWQDEHNIWRIGGPAAQEVGPPLKLFPSNGDDLDPVYSPDGGRVAFISDRTGTRELWVADAADGEPRQLSRLGFALGAQWHSGGDQIAFFAFPAGESHGEIYVIDSSGGVARNMTDDEFDDMFPCWSADGDWIYFQSQRVTSDPYEIWRIPIEGGHSPEQITGGGAGRPLFHNGRIYFSRGKQIWSAAPGGGDEELLLDGPNVSTLWQPWNNKLVYVRILDASTGIIEVLDLDTNQTREHTRIDLPSGTVPWAGLAVSPDGQYILFSRLDTAGSDLMLVENYR